MNEIFEDEINKMVEDMKSTPTIEKKKCRCKEMSCKDDCETNHTHKGVFCNICEPEAVKQIENTSKPIENNEIVEGWEEKLKKDFYIYEDSNGDLKLQYILEDGNTTAMFYLKESVSQAIQSALQKQKSEIVEKIEKLMKESEPGTWCGLNDALSIIEESK